MTVYNQILEYKRKGEKGIFVLLDPDKYNPAKLAERALKAESLGAKAVLIGGSHLGNDHFDRALAEIKKNLQIPLIIFPGESNQVSRHADAIFFLSLISGRNPQFLISEHVKAAPIVKKIGLETISTGYMLVESGKISAAEFISDTRPIPRDQLNIAVAHALAGELLGMKLIYLEAGSGAKMTVPLDMILAVSRNIDIPLLVGGGIRNPREAEEIAASGADFIVVGNALEEPGGDDLLKKMIKAIVR